MISALLLTLSFLPQPASLSLAPDSVVLTGPLASQRLLLLQTTPGRGSLADLTGGASFESSDPAIAKVDEAGVLEAVSDGRVQIKATAADGRSTSIQVRVEKTGSPFSWSFRTHVRAVMTKAGCNSGPCHGAAAGQNYFKLTLRGYAPEIDYDALTKQDLGRRLSLVAPAQSLMLLKPTLAVAHEGGRRFGRSSLDYRILSQWIAAGAPGPRKDDLRVERLEVLPLHATLKPEDEHQLLVRGSFSDGHTEDLTRWAKYTSSDAGVATVSSDGLVQVTGHGETTIAIWCLDRVAAARITVPFPENPSPNQATETAPVQNFIDDLVREKLQELRIPASETCSDSDFMRRAYLDAIGILPTAPAARAFSLNASPGKRSRLIDDLLRRPEFVDYWSYQWSDLLLVSSSKLSRAAMRSYYHWIRNSVASNKPWDQMAREIVTASGSNFENGAANYYVLHDEPTALAENVTLTFMGLSIGCARCHNHPLDKWTQDQYYALSSFFSRVGRKNDLSVGYASNPRSLGETTIFTAEQGEVVHPRLGHPLPPRPLEGEFVPEGDNRRQQLADWLTSPQNHYFVRSIVNRIWGHFMGRGLVEPANDMRETNAASNQKLMRRLTKEFVNQGFDIRQLIRTLMNSAAYQKSSEPASKMHDGKYYSHYQIKRLPAEVIVDIISQVTGVAQPFKGYPAGVRAVQLPDSRVDSYALTVFGRPQRQINSYAERIKHSTVSQVLHLINGDIVSEKLRSPSSTLDRLIRQGLSQAEIIREIYWTSLSRAPGKDELDEVQRAFAEAIAPASSVGERARLGREVMEDFWAGLIMGKEFLFNH